MSLARRGILPGLLAALLGGCSAAAMLNATVPREGSALERDIDHVDVVAAFSDFLHKRALTRADILAWTDKV
jgi:hypothetical protein